MQYFTTVLGLGQYTPSWLIHWVGLVLFISTSMGLGHWLGLVQWLSPG